MKINSIYQQLAEKKQSYHSHHSNKAPRQLHAQVAIYPFYISYEHIFMRIKLKYYFSQ